MILRGVVALSIAMGLIGATGCLATTGVSADDPEQPTIPSSTAHDPTATVTATSVPPATPTPTIPPTPTATPRPLMEGPFTIGTSVLGRPLEAYRIGKGPISRVIIGGIHGGYEWNTTVLVNRLVDYFWASPELVPPEVTLYLIPCANPDGAAAGTDRIHGRMNANGVDLNRNWDYEWQSVASHGPWPVSGGTAPFSEPETAALRDFILSRGIQAAIFYHSALSMVFAGAGRETSKTEELALLMARYTGYQYMPNGLPGQITTGDAIDWLTSIGITAVEIELTTHEDLDWTRNLQAMLAFLQWDLPE
ncbi:MAG: M14 family metallopeptidase [Anaerolineales bacterium]|jgi:hypothetical protein